VNSISRDYGSCLHSHISDVRYPWAVETLSWDRIRGGRYPRAVKSAATTISCSFTELKTGPTQPDDTQSANNPREGTVSPRGN